MQTSPPSGRGGEQVALLVPALLVALNLRPLIAGLPPVLHNVRASLGLSNLETDLLTTLPVVCLGVFAPLASLADRHLGTRRALAMGSVVIAAGAIIRTGGVALMYVGTLIGAAGIAVVGVLMPTLVRQAFANRPGTATGAYTAVLTGGAALAAATTVPLSRALGGWRPGLAIWAVPAVVAALAIMRTDAASPRHPTRPETITPGHGDRLGPQVLRLAALTALLSFSYYSMLTWLPSRYRSVGFSADRAGLILGIVNAAQIPAALLLPRLADRGRQRVAIAVFAVLAVGGLAGIALLPRTAPEVLAVLTGLGQGGGLAVGLTLIATAARDARHTASVSWRAQSAGYLVGAAGPLLIGLLHQTSGSWSLAFLTVAAVTALQLPVALSVLRSGARAALVS